MNNLHLFELINAAPHPEAWQLNLALALAQWLIFLVPVGPAADGRQQFEAVFN